MYIDQSTLINLHLQVTRSLHMQECRLISDNTASVQASV